MTTYTWTIAAMEIDEFGKHIQRILENINANPNETVRDTKFNTTPVTASSILYSALVIIDSTAAVSDDGHTDAVDSVNADEN